MKYFFTFINIAFLGVLWGQSPMVPQQPSFSIEKGVYRCDSVQTLDFAQVEDGYFLFLPASPRPDTANVIIFIHGYGAINPMLFGKWITHLVRQGNIIIYPRYQRNLFRPKVTEFTPNAATGIRSAIIYLQEESDIKPNLDHLVFFGHSYGGVIASNLAVDYELYEVPKPEGLMISAAGTAKLTAGMRADYSDFPKDIKLIIITNKDDKTTGDFFGLKLFREAQNTREKVYFRQYADHHGYPVITAGHNTVQCIDEIYDSGVHNYTARHAKRVSTFDVLDYNGYWRIFDQLLRCVRTGKDCAIMNPAPRRFDMGKWSDGVPIESLKVELPDSLIRKAGTIKQP